MADTIQSSIIATRHDQIFPVLEPAEVERLSRFGEARNYASGETLVKTPHRSGHKLHVTVSLQHHQQLAAVILPTLRLLHTHHKVILPGLYANYGSGPLAGKFISFAQIAA